MKKGCNRSNMEQENKGNPHPVPLCGFIGSCWDGWGCLGHGPTLSLELMAVNLDPIGLLC